MIGFRDVSETGVGPPPLRKGVLFRAAGPQYGLCQEYSKIKTWIDLRTPQEIDGTESSLQSRHHVPFKISDEAFASVARPKQEDWASLYCRAFDRFMPHLINVVEIFVSSQKPLLISCTAGKDRTGIVIAFLLFLAGSNDSSIARDYCKTSQFAWELCQNYPPHLRDNKLSMEEATNLYFVPHRESIVSLLSHFRRRESEILGRLTQARLEELRHSLVLKNFAEK
jgi:hypothetical protein